MRVALYFVITLFGLMGLNGVYGMRMLCREG